MILQYDIPVEVTKQEHDYLMQHLHGNVAGREDNGKYYIKAWLGIKYCNEVLNELRSK